MTQKKYWENETLTELRQFSLSKTAEENLKEEIDYLDNRIREERNKTEKRKLIKKSDGLKKRLIPLRMQINRLERSLAALSPEKRFIIEAIYLRGLKYEDIMIEHYIEHTKFYDLRRCAIQELTRALYGIDIRHLSGDMPPEYDSET